jgi:opacity protein-like surface antigen
MRYIAMLLLSGLLTTSAFSQSGITLQGTAGIGIPTDSDFSEGLNAGLALGGRFGYKVADNIELTAAITFNRFGVAIPDEKEFLFEKASIIVMDDIDFELLGLRGGARYTTTPGGSVGFNGLVEVGMTRQQVSTSFGTFGSEWDPALGVGAGVQYFFSPRASVGIGPMFNMIFAEESYHDLDIIASVIVSL